MRWFQASASLVCLLLLFSPAGARAEGGASGEIPAEPELACRALIREAERANRIPAQLLSAVSLTESGRWSDERSEHIAWPWTIHAEGRGHYFATRAEALAALRRLKARGVSNIDVGCMQVNLHYHGDAFDSLAQALDPAENVAYAARYLVELKQQSHSWTRAVGLYHSSSRERQSAYRDRVNHFWQLERRRAMEERQQRAQAAWAARQAERRTALAEK